MTGKILSKGGFEVSLVSSGDQALESMERVQPDLVLSDLRMPLMDGWELHREIRLRGYEMPFMAMSGQFDGDVQEVDGFVGKPFNMQGLIDNVGLVMSRKAIA